MRPRDTPGPEQRRTLRRATAAPAIGTTTPSAEPAVMPR
jgi:hypothetical protein